MVNQAFRIKIAYRSEKEKKEEKEKEKKIPGIGRYPMGPTNRKRSVFLSAENSQSSVISFCEGHQ